MKKVNALCLMLALVLRTFSIYAEEIGNSNVDFQLRIPFHAQYVPESWKVDDKTELGIAGWAVLPDVMARGNNTATLFACGPLLKYGDGSWAEIMGGCKRNEDGYTDPFVNLRFLEKRISRLNIGGDLEYYPGEERRRFYSLLTADTPISLGKYSMRAGLESENIFFFSGKKDSFGVGPRIVFPIPQKLSPHFAVALTIGYQHRTDRDFLRCYLVFTYPPFHKRK